MTQTPDSAQTADTAQAPTTARPARTPSKGKGVKAARPKTVPKPAASKPRAARARGVLPGPASETKAPAGKLGVVAAMLLRPEGATVAQMSEATGWQAHSVRGAIAGSLKKKHGLVIVTEAAEGGRVYRIATAAA